MKNRELKNLVSILLNKDSYHDELLNTTKLLSEFFESFSDISTKSSHLELEEDSNHIYLDLGVAISPLDAAICTNEYMRTTKYIRGVYEAINDLLLKFQDKKIHILYAGCGPYATLIIPILSFFDSEKLEVSFLDIHKSSLNSVKSIISGLGFEDFVSEYIQEDATKYKASKDIHLIITETMKAAFDDEPQISITLNLLPQLHKEGIFIPKRVVVGLEKAYYKMINKNNILSKEKKSEYLCDVINLDTSFEIKKEDVITSKHYIINDDIDEKMQLQFTTTIHIYENNILKENECSLNIPKIIKFKQKPSIGDKFNFDYIFDNKPKIKYTLNTGISKDTKNKLYLNKNT